MEIETTSTKFGYTTKITFNSGKKVIMEITEEKIDWIQMFFETNVIPNVKTLGKIAVEKYLRSNIKTVAFDLSDSETSLI